MFSFVIPVYNIDKDILTSCLDSVLRNGDSDDNIEIIIVDDHSVNGCEKLCDTYAANDERIKVYHQETNQGVSAARNLGITKCSGEYIVFVDADDRIEPDTCRILSKYCGSEPDLIIYSADWESKAGNYEFGVADRVYEYNAAEDPNVNRELKKQLYGKILTTSPLRFETLNFCWGKAFKREFLNEHNIRFVDLSFCEDMIFMSSVLDHAETVIQIPERLYHYRVTDSSAVNSYRPFAIAEQKKFLEYVKADRDAESLGLIYYAALMSMQILITRFLFNDKNPNTLKRKKSEAEKYFSKWPFSEIFEHVDYNNMKPDYKVKAMLLKRKQYYLYYLATQVKKYRTIKLNNIFKKRVQ